MEVAIGWLESDSPAMRSSMSWSSEYWPSKISIFVTVNSPLVRVPVLSKMTFLTELRLSR